MRKYNGFWARLYIAVCFAFFYLPIIVTVIFSFNSSKSLSHFTGFSLRWYSALIEDNEIVQAVYVSVTIAVIATIVSTILGTMTAIGLSRSRKVLKDAILSINDIPILNPDIVTAISWMLLFSSMGLAKGYFTMLLAHIGFCTPFVITSVYPKVRSLDPNLANAAMDLGATPVQALTKVILPMIKPGIFAGILLAFTMSFDDFVISYFVTGNGVKNISIVVYNMTKRINPIINALSTIVIVVIVAILIVVNLTPRIVEKRAAARRAARDAAGAAAIESSGDSGIYRPSEHRHRRIGAGALIAVLGIALVAGSYAAAKKSSSSSAGAVRELRVYNAGEYMDLSLLDRFQQEYNCTVIYETFDSNEMMYTKLLAGDQYDILVPSDYMIERLIKEDYLQPIDWSLISNKDAIDPNVMDKAYDPGNVYSVPYFWGSVGILYDKTVVDKKDLKDGWNLLMNTKYKGNLYMYDSERDSFMVALKALGYSMNTTDEKQINDAYEWLIRQRRTMDPIYAGDDVIDNMISGNKAMAVVYSGDAAMIMSENDKLDYFEPPEGTNNWYDAMVITRDCRNVGLAHDFIDFMLQEDVAEQNTAYVGYSSPVKAVYEKMQKGTYAGIDAYVPRTGYGKDEIFGYQDTDIKKLFAQLWTKVKAQ